MNNYEYLVHETGSHTEEPMASTNGHALWKYVVAEDGAGRWELYKNHCQDGYRPAAPPEQPGDFPGHLRAVAGEPIDRHAAVSDETAEEKANEALAS